MPSTCLVYFHMLKLCYSHSVMTGLALFQAVLMTVHTYLVVLHKWLCQSFSSIQWQWLLSNDVNSRTASAKWLCQVYSASLTEYCAMSTRVKRHSECLINKVWRCNITTIVKIAVTCNIDQNNRIIVPSECSRGSIYSRVQ